MRHHDLVVIGTGSGNSVVGEAFAGLDVGIVEQGRFGGTCLNAGCIPTKILAHTADVVRTVRDAATFDVDARTTGVRWTAVQERVFGRLDPIERDGRRHRVDDGDVTVYEGHARFTGPRTLRIERTGSSGGDPSGGDPSGIDEVTADRIVVAAGGRPLVPEPVASAGVPFETSDTIMRIPAPPARLAILGGGYIAMEFAHVFSALGARVTVIDRADTLLAGQDEEVARRYTALARERHDVRTGREVAEAAAAGTGVRLTLDDGAVVEADMLLVAVGRVPNGDRMDLAKAGIDTHDDGRIVVDRQLRTTAEGVWALGDVSTAVPLKHVANREAEVVAHNLLHPDDPRETDDTPVPAAVFGDPQVASIGATEQDLREGDLDWVAGEAEYADTAFGWALEDTTGFAKVLAERGTGRLLGAHVMGPHAAILVQPLVVAMACGIDARTLAQRPYWIHPALTEVVENALRALDG
ncbi:MAG: mycothione reductase [Pseudonocardiales bacterium]|nr:mycothione reductase [Pseudonocardiales bacterium]